MNFQRSAPGLGPDCGSNQSTLLDICKENLLKGVNLIVEEKQESVWTLATKSDKVG